MIANDLIKWLQDEVAKRPELGVQHVRVMDERNPEEPYYTIAFPQLNDWRFVFPMIVLLPERE